MLYQSTGTISGGTLAILWWGKPIPLDDLIGKYCRSMIERNLSDNTITAYTHVVRSVYQSKNMVYLSLDAGVSIVAASLLSAYFGSRVETEGHGDFALSWSGSTVNIGLNTNPVLDGVQPSFMKVFSVRVWYWD